MTNNKINKKPRLITQLILKSAKRINLDRKKEDKPQVSSMTLPIFKSLKAIYANEVSSFIFISILRQKWNLSTV